MNLREKLQALPSTPGVYLMKDSQGHIIYVGKSKNLKNRVRSYFQNSKAHSPKVKQLVQHLKDFELLLTDTEFEAFMLECRLIKEHKPLYNRKMKTPQSYTYINIQPEHGLRRIRTDSHPAETGGSLNFGPYTSRSTVERAVQGIQESMKLMCSGTSSRNSPCLNHSLGLCMGVCLGGETVAAYDRIIDGIVSLLNGADTGILDAMTQRMTEAAENYEFESAAKYRDYIHAVNILLRKEKVIEFTEENHNIAIIETIGDCVVKLFLIKGNRQLSSRKYNVNDAGKELLHAEVKAHILHTFKQASTALPLEIGKHDIDEAQIIYSYLKGSSVSHLIFSEELLKQENHSGLDEALHQLLGVPEQSFPIHAELS
jgi:excinuclease ABC subunit C